MSVAEIAIEIAAPIPSGLTGGDEILGVSTDTRTIKPGDVYVALKGERFDGHDYVDQALAAGAVCAIVSRGSGARSLLVDDTLVALGKIAAAWRRRLTIPIVAVTGSVGKTTSKEMIACALSPLGPVIKTEKNENNEIGLPKTLLRLDEQSAAAVVEMGMRGLGQIAYLAEIARPTVGIITVIGESHIELLGSRDAIATAKTELFDALSTNNGTAVFNAADDYAEPLREAAGRRALTFADGSGQFAPPSNFRLMDAVRDGEGWQGTAFGPGNARFTLRIKSPARHDLVNALGAVAVAHAAGVPVTDSAAALETYRPGAMRMEIVRGRGGVTILSDCYNAAPASMKAALETLALTESKGRKVAFLGDMKELGEHAASMHKSVIETASRLGLTEIYVVGDEFARAAPDARGKFTTSAAAATFARTELAAGESDIVLVKGSRAMAMELVVEELSETEAQAAA